MDAVDDAVELLDEGDQRTQILDLDRGFAGDVAEAEVDRPA